MNRLELGMRHSNPDERGAVSGIVKERLQLPQSDRHFVGRRNKFGLVQAATYGTNPVLTSSQISGIQVKTSSMRKSLAWISRINRTETGSSSKHFKPWFIASI